MQKMKILVTGICASIALVGCSTTRHEDGETILPLAATEQAEKPTPVKLKAISVDDLHNKYKIIGPLGQPVWKPLTVEGTPFETQWKGQTKRLQISSVDGRRLKTPVVMIYDMYYWADLRDTELTPGRLYKLRAYQDAGMVGVPDEIGVDDDITVPQVRIEEFSSWLIVYKIIK